MSDSITDAGVLHLSDYFSDHSPVFCKLKNHAVATRTSSNSSVNINAIPNWKKATDIQKFSYFNELRSQLQNINIPTCVTNCCDVHCKDKMHSSANDDLMLEVLSSVENSANNHIPTPKINNSDNFHTSIPN